jgi:protein required for attachment to host cells
VFLAVCERNRFAGNENRAARSKKFSLSVSSRLTSIFAPGTDHPQRGTSRFQGNRTSGRRSHEEHSGGLRIVVFYHCINEDNMPATWILSANASRAQFFSQSGASQPLEEISDMVNEDARLRELEKERDKVGPTAATKSIHNVGGATPNKTYEPPVPAQKHDEELFARHIAGYLEQAHREGRFQQLSLVVSPEFLGVLRGLLPPQLKSIVNLEINKDYTHLRSEQLREQIQANKP